MPWAAAGTPDVSANIPIAPMIQIDAGIIVSLYLVACRLERLLRGWQMAELIIIPQGAGMATSAINGFTAVTGTRTRRLRREIGRMMTLFLPRCMLGLRIKGTGR